MSKHQNDSNVYKPKLTGFLIAAIALVLLVVILLASTIMILSLGSGADKPAESTKQEQTSKTEASTTTPPETTDEPDPAETTAPDPAETTAPDEPIDPPAVPVDPSRVPTKVSPDETKVIVPSQNSGEGSLILLDDEHTYLKDPALLISRAEMSAMSAEKVREEYGFERVTAASGNYTLARSNLFLNSDTLYYFEEMLKDYAEESGNKDVQIRNCYYYSGADDIESVEHATGYYVDLQIYRSQGTYPLNYETFKQDYYSWFVDNCWKYGFLHVRDTASYSSFRFVGAAHSAAMNKFSLDLGQYLEAVETYSYENYLKVTDGFGWEWWVYYVETAGDLTEIPVIGNEDSYHISGTNDDGFVVAINSSCFS